MLSNFGNCLIVLNIFFTLTIIYSSLENLKYNNQIIPKSIFQYSLLQSTITLISFSTLILAFIISDFSLINVYQNSHTLKPLFYKISGTWGNHEGSLLLWINVLVIFSYLFLIINKKSPKSFRLYTLIVQNVLILGFVLFLFFNSNPFSILDPTPTQGLGLNPILQDPALAIHPPLLYIGFVGSSIYFSAAVGSLLSSYNGNYFAKAIKNWVLVSWSFQTLGIIMGSIWAYYELGWGGFWFWDPVENASLLPWFAMAALVHSIMVLEKRNTLYPWVIILCLLTFILSVTGTFLVRSGILNSVHTFANDPTRGLYILIFLSGMILFSLFIFFTKIKSEKISLNFLSKEFFVLTNNWFMMFFLITVFIGTVYPLFTEVLSQTKISVGPPFYNIVITPLVVPFLFLMAIGPQSRWIKNSFNQYKNLILILLCSIFLNLIIFFIFKKYNFIFNLIFISSIFLIIYTLKDLMLINRKNIFNRLPRIISHMGFGFLIFFIGINYNFSEEKDVNLKIGENIKFNDYQINFNDMKIEERKNYRAVVGQFDFINLKNRSQNKLNPEIRIYSNPKTITYEAAIRTNLYEDYYITMSNIDRSEFYNIKFQKKPFMIWIWISALLISIGGFLRIFKNEN